MCVRSESVCACVLSEYVYMCVRSESMCACVLEVRVCIHVC